MTYDEITAILPRFPKVVSHPPRNADWDPFVGTLLGVRKCDCCDNFVAEILCDDGGEVGVGIRYVEPHLEIIPGGKQ